VRTAFRLLLFTHISQWFRWTAVPKLPATMLTHRFGNLWVCCWLLLRLLLLLRLHLVWLCSLLSALEPGHLYAQLSSLGKIKPLSFIRRCLSEVDDCVVTKAKLGQIRTHHGIAAAAYFSLVTVCDVSAVEAYSTVVERTALNASKPYERACRSTHTPGHSQETLRADGVADVNCINDPATCTIQADDRTCRQPVSKLGKLVKVTKLNSAK
jgi:hypothetical protein